jgi:hypothetical protein
MRRYSNYPHNIPPDIENMPADPADMPAPLDEPTTAPRRSAHDGFRPGPFDHERLDAYRVVREALVAGDLVAQHLPPEHAALVAELRRALLGAQLGLAQAASRGGADRSERFSAARGEVARAAAALDAALALGLVDAAAVEPPLTLLGRLSAMLVRLIARAQGGR